MIRRRKRGGRLPVAVLTVVAGIVAVALLLEHLPSRGIVAAPVSAPAGEASAAEPGESFDALFRFGLVALREGKAHDAARAFEAARRLRPHVPEAYVNLGYAYLALGRPSAAQHSFERAIGLRPAQANAYFGLAESHEARDDVEGALGAMKSYLHLGPEKGNFHRRALAAVWEWESALADKRIKGQDGEAAAENPRPAQQRGSGEHGLKATSLQRLDGGWEALDGYLGRTVVLNVWATWCLPCRAELPSLQRLSQSVDPKRFAVIGLSVDEDPDFVREYLNDLGVTYRNYIDGTQDIASAVFEVESFPQTLVIGPDGSLRERVMGQRSWDEPNIVARLKEVR